MDFVNIETGKHFSFLQKLGDNTILLHDGVKVYKVTMETFIEWFVCKETWDMRQNKAA